MWNLLAVSHALHMKRPNYKRIGWHEAEKREAFLQRHPEIAKAVNMEGLNETE